MAEQHLKKYNEKRDFKNTPEPAGKVHKRKPEKGDGTFVIQKHAATRLHYDLRFEVEGVMPSWAVPKGPSYNPADKRLAVHVEDHPLDYQTFEGIIAKGQYGGGTVVVWDRGTYTNVSEKDGEHISMRDAIENGHVSVVFDGVKMKGEWGLIHTGGRMGENAWLLVKSKDEFASTEVDVTEFAPNSVVTDRSLDEVAADENSAVHHSNRS